MSPSPRLVERALSQVDSCERETGSKCDPKTIVEIVLDLFEVSEQWRADASETTADEARFDSVRALLDQFPGAQVLHHRFVATTEWERVRAQIEWTPE